MWQVMLIRFFVDILLLLGVKRLSNFPSNIRRVPLAALYGSIFAGCSMLTAMAFLNQPLWQVFGLAATGMLSFGVTVSALRVDLVYVLLHLALSSVTKSSGGNLVACCVFSFCVLVLQKEKSGLYVPVEINHNGRKLSLTALRDTGNCLRDPITGKPVLIVDALTAKGLTGLSGQQLGNPIDTVGAIPGLRLIPYKTVGGTGLLLALRLQDVKIGSWQGSSLVAFSPETFSVEGMYQALTGGNV